MTYIFIYLFSGLLAKISLLKSKVNNKLFNKILIIFSIGLTTLFSGFRSMNLGTDNPTYNNYFQTIYKIQNLTDLFNDAYLSRVELEPLFRILLFVVSRLGNNYAYLTTFISFLTITIIYIAAYKRKNNISPFFVIIGFYFLYFGNTWNIMQQGLALSIVFLANYYLDEHKLVKFLLLGIVAGLVHSSAFFAILIIFVSNFILKKDKLFYKIIIVIVFMFLIVFFKNIMEIVVRIIPSYSNYLIHFENGFDLSLGSFAALIERLPIFIVFSIFYKKISKANPRFKFYFMMLIFDLLFSQLGIYYGPMYRLSLYFQYYILIMLPLFIRSFNKNSNENLLSKYIVLLYMLLYWIIYVALNFYGFANPVYPYRSDLIRITLY